MSNRLSKRANKAWGSGNSGFLGFKADHLPRIFLGLLLLALLSAHVAGFIDSTVINKLERFSYDLRLTNTLSKGIDPRIVIVDIDEKSLATEGQWPWRRDRLKVMLDHLFDHYQVAVLGFDMLFAEREENADLMQIKALATADKQTDVINYLTQIQPQLDRNRLFAASIKHRPVVLGYYFDFFQSNKENIGHLPEAVLPADLLHGSMARPLLMKTFSANLAELQTAAHSAGFFQNDRIDDDGLIRRVPMLVAYNNALYESLSLAMVRTLLNDTPVLPVFSDDLAGADSHFQAVDFLQVGDFLLPVDDQLSCLVPFRGRQGRFTYLSASDILTKRADAALLKNAIVLVGTTAPGLLDLNATPVQSSYPGVEIHATMIAGMLDQTIKKLPTHLLGYELISLLLIGFLLVFLFPRLSPALLSITTFALLVGVIGINIRVWHEANMVFNLATPLLLIVLLFVVNMAHGFFVEARNKKKLSALFGEYVPPTIVKVLSENPNASKDITENRQMTVLFSDVKDFTTLSEGLAPETLSALMNAFLTPLTRIIHQHHGTIDKYMGDAIMAFWGAPMADEQHAKQALDASMAILHEVERINVRFKQRGWPALQIQCGLNTGNMAVGNMGSEFRRAYTVLGDAVNLGARCESITRKYGVLLIASEYTQQAVTDYVYRELDVVKVKGKEKAVTLFEPIAPVAEVTQSQQQELSDYHKALTHYREQQWAAAEAAFLALEKQEGNKVIYTIYLARLAELKAHPPCEKREGQVK